MTRTFQRLCCRHVTVLVRSSPGQRRGQERAPRWPTEQPRQVRAAQPVLRGRSVETPQGEWRAGRAPQDLNAETKISRRPCYQPTTVLVRSSPGRQRGEECAPRWPTTQPRQVRAAPARAPWAVGRISTGREARALCGCTALKSAHWTSPQTVSATVQNNRAFLTEQTYMDIVISIVNFVLLVHLLASRHATLEVDMVRLLAARLSSCYLEYLFAFMRK